MESFPLISFPSRGMRLDIDSSSIPGDAYGEAVNVRIDNEQLKQRYGVRCVPLTSDEEGLVEEFQQLNWQGGVSYTPSQGQSAIQFASKGNFIVCSAGGRKFSIEISGQGSSVKGVLTEVTGPLQQAPDVHQVWLAQVENYVVAGDDFSQTWIWDGVNEAFASAGSETPDRNDAQVPNFSRLPAYTQGRLAMVSTANGLEIGDIIHGRDLSNSNDIIRFTEQTYWAEGQRFVMPTEAGSILATYTLPIIGDVNGQGDFIVDCEKQCFSIKTYVFPRREWGTGSVRMVESVSSDGGARGQFAFDVFNNDALRRTSKGIESLTFSSTGGELVNKPQERLSFPIDDFLKYDYAPRLRHCSLKFIRRQDKIFCTVRPTVYRDHWYHRGFVSYNYEYRIWESINTMPKAYKDIKQFINMELAGEQRSFCIVGGDGKNIQLIEFDDTLSTDLLPDGSESRIQSQIQTREFYDNHENMLELDNMVLNFDGVSGKVDYEVYFQPVERRGTWTLWREDCFDHDRCSAPAVKRVKLGSFPGLESADNIIKNSRSYRFLIKWRGIANLRFGIIDVDVASGKGDNDPMTETCEKTYDPYDFNYDTFEYSKL